MSGVRFPQRPLTTPRKTWGPRPAWHRLVVSRGLSLSILLLAVLAVLAGLQFTKGGEGTNEGCSGVRQAYERAAFIQTSRDVPTPKVYADAAIAVRKVAVRAPAAVAADLNGMADAYSQLGRLLEGFDPDDPSTYDVIEDNTAAIESQQATIETSLPEVRTWLDDRCK
jgi:hypothetical protein